MKKAGAPSWVEMDRKVTNRGAYCDLLDNLLELQPFERGLSRNGHPKDFQCFSNASAASSTLRCSPFKKNGCQDAVQQKILVRDNSSVSLATNERSQAVFETATRRSAINPRYNADARNETDPPNDIIQTTSLGHGPYKLLYHMKREHIPRFEHYLDPHEEQIDL